MRSFWATLLIAGSWLLWNGSLWPGILCLWLALVAVILAFIHGAGDRSYGPGRGADDDGV